MRRLEIKIQPGREEKEKIFRTNIRISRAKSLQTFQQLLGKKKLKAIGKQGKRIIKKIFKSKISTPCTISIAPNAIIVRANSLNIDPNWAEIESKVISAFTSLAGKVENIDILREEPPYQKPF